MKREAVKVALTEMQKSFEKAARCLDAADRLSDAARNAELMRTLHQVGDQLDAARRALGKASGTAVMFGNQLMALLPDEQPLAKSA